MITVDFIPLRMAGSLREGERDKGTIWHAVAVCDRRDPMALCGKRPAMQWTSEPGDAITCARCLRILTDMGVRR